jgi:hypothetical protein
VLPALTVAVSVTIWVVPPPGRVLLAEVTASVVLVVATARAEGIANKRNTIERNKRWIPECPAIPLKRPPRSELILLASAAYRSSLCGYGERPL